MQVPSEPIQPSAARAAVAGDPAAGSGRVADAGASTAAAPSFPARAAASLALLAAPVATLWSTAALAALGDGLRPSWGARYPLVMALAVISGALCLRAALLVLPRRRGAPPRLSLAHVRLLLVVAALGTTVHLVWLQPFSLPVALATVTLSGGVFGLLALGLASRVGRPAGRFWRGVDLLVTSLVLAALVLELGLRAFSEARPHPLLVGGSGDARSFLDAWRGEPGALRFRFPLNQRGDYDHEWTGRSAGQGLVVCIGDSFSTTTVPHPLHYTTWAERELEDTEVYNMGAPSIGPPEYLLLLEEEALPMRPDAVVIGLFVGNDLDFRVPGPRDAPRLRAILDADEVVLARLVRRLRAIAAERSRQGGGPVGLVEGIGGEGGLVTTVEEAHAAFPYTADPTLERPTFSAPEYARIEASRAAGVCRPDRDFFPVLERYLESMRQAAGRVPLVLLLIPDEFQIEDGVWSQVQETLAGIELERDRPQRLIREWCEANGVPLLDLLPLFREQPVRPSGRRELYTLQDTHWNAGGNELAGRALGGDLRELLGE